MTRMIGNGGKWEFANDHPSPPAPLTGVNIGMRTPVIATWRT